MLVTYNTHTLSCVLTGTSAHAFACTKPPPTHTPSPPHTHWYTHTHTHTHTSPCLFRTGWWLRLVMSTIRWWYVVNDAAWRCACCYLLKVSPVSLVVLAIRLALFSLWHTHTHTHAHTHAHTYTHTHKYTHKYTHTHTNTHTLSLSHTNTHNTMVCTNTPFFEKASMWAQMVGG